MHRPPSSGKFSFENLPARPCMMGDADVALIDQILADLPAKARMIEFGPWLGGISQRLAPHGELHVVDRFIWSALNAEKYPGVLPEGGNFRVGFERLMHQQDLTATIHECEIEEFDWPGDPLDFCLIDAPRDGLGLWDCLRTILGSLTPQGYVLIKHGLNPANVGMLALIDGLLATDVLELVPTDQPKWCNIAALRAGPRLDQFSSKSTLSDWIIAGTEADPRITDMTRERLILHIARMAHLAAQGLTEQALSMLRQHDPDPRVLTFWSSLEPQLLIEGDHEGTFAGFAEIFEFHHSARQRDLWVAPDHSLSWALRHSWSAHLTATQKTEFNLSQVAKDFALGRIANFNSQTNEAGHDTSG